MSAHPHRRFLVGACLLMALAAKSVMAFQPMDESSLEALHYGGLDAPAAGESRAAVSGAATQVTSDRLQQDSQGDLPGSDDLSATIAQESVVNESIVNTNNQNVTERLAEISIQRTESANQSGSETVDENTAAITLMNEVSLIQVNNLRHQPDALTSRGSYEIQNLRVDSQINIQQR